MVYCAVPVCTNSSNNSSVSFHTFPKDGNLRKEWLRNIKRDIGKNFKLTANTKVCSSHFRAEDYTFNGYSRLKRLKPGAVPSVFDWSKETRRRKEPVCRSTTSVKNGTQTEVDTATEPLDFYQVACELSPRSDESLEEEATNSVSLATFCSLPDHDYTVEPQSKDDMLAAARDEIARLTAKLEIAEGKTNIVNRLAGDNSSVMFYTGFKDYQTLLLFFQVIEPTAVNMVRYTQYRRRLTGESKQTRVGFYPQNLSLIDQFTLVLRRLRVGNCDKELADIYQVSEATVSRIVLSWVNYLYFFLGSLPLWASRAQVDKHMPDVFIPRYSRTRVILDCTEVWVQKPSSLVLSSEFYSHYKGRATLKALVGIAPSGAVSFVSKLYPGSISDKAITKVSGILELLENGDTVMVDKGFLIGDLLEQHGVNLVIPAFLSERSQFEAGEVSETQAIARLRVHVERAIRRVKCFGIFKRVIPLALTGSVNQIWSVCCLITNFQGDLF